MDGRYPHFLTALADKRNPDRIVCVDPASDVDDREISLTTRVERLNSWSATRLRRAQGELVVAWEMSDTTTKTFWEMLVGEVRHPGVVWVVSYQCTRAWALLGLWKMLESGEARVAGGDARAVYDPIKFGPKTKPGLLVNEDPPNIAQLRIGPHPGIIMWIDCRNWGVDVSPAVNRGKAVVGDLANLVVRLDQLGSGSVGLTLAPTAAGAAWRSWRKDVVKYGVHSHVGQHALDLERNAHLGGRCECFRIGKLSGKWYHLDFRSAYAAVMATELMPVRLEHHYQVNKGHKEKVLRDFDRAIACVTVSTDEPAYPLLRDGLIVYPVGKFIATLCGPELMDAVQKDRVVAWHEIAFYDLVQATKEWVMPLYHLRCAADAAGDKQLSAYAKAVINSLPGKLGQKFRCWEVVPGALAPEPWGEWHAPDANGKLIRWRALAGVCQKENVGGYAPDAVPAMAAWINSCGRMKLLNAIRVAGWEETAYVDTDCLIVSKTGLYRLREHGIVEDGELGYLEIRSSPANVEILGVKHYVEDDLVKCSGCPNGSVVLSADGKSRWRTNPTAKSPNQFRGCQVTSYLEAAPVAARYRHGTVDHAGRVHPFRLGS